MHPDLKVTVSVVDDVTVVAVEGELDLRSRVPFQGALRKAIGPTPAVLIDLCACTFIDSAGLSTILVAVQQAKAGGVRLGISCLPDGAPRKLFDLTLGHSMFTTGADRESGIRALRSPPQGEA